MLFAKTSLQEIIVSIVSLSFRRHLKVGRTTLSRGYYDVIHKPLRHSNLAVKYTKTTITSDIPRCTGKRREQLLLY